MRHACEPDLPTRKGGEGARKSEGGVEERTVKKTGEKKGEEKEDENKQQLSVRQKEDDLEGKTEREKEGASMQQTVCVGECYECSLSHCSLLLS